MKKKQLKLSLIGLNPITASILLSLSGLAYADTNSVNGVPVVNINGANSNGISHNIYDKFNVGKEGLILNNSKIATNTALAGQISGNSNLAAGSAKVILNEVTTQNASSLNGLIEVAGNKASVIIANPNGIACHGCGFINAENITLTTGKPDIKNGELKGYSVNGGKITIQDLSSDSPTAILARSVVVNGKINAKEITVVAGNNYVNASNEVTGTVTATGSRNTYSIDVAKLGGMYANQINLISTESGVGVRNQGEFAAASGGIQIDSQGQLINNAAEMKTTGGINIKTKAAFNNVSGSMLADKDINIDTNKTAFNNTLGGQIASASNIYINAGVVNNTNGRLAASNTLAINTNNNTLTNSGQGKTVGIAGAVVALQTGELNNTNGQIEGYYIGSDSTSVNNSKGIIDAYGDVDMKSTGRVNNNGGLIRSGIGHVSIDAIKSTFTNAQTKTASGDGSDALGVIAGEGGIYINANLINNSTGQILSDGNINLNSATAVSNVTGKIVAQQKTSIKATSMNNTQSGLVGQKGISVDLGNGVFVNDTAVVRSEAGDITFNAKMVNNHGGLMAGENITIRADEVRNDEGLMVANGKLKITATGNVNNANSDGFTKNYGLYLGMRNQKGGMIGKGGVDITAKNLSNNRSRLVADGSGPLVLALSGSLDNQYGLLSGGIGASSIKATTINANYSTINASGDLSVDTGALTLAGSGSLERNTATGIISADGNLSLNIKTNFTNYGWVNANNSLNMHIAGALVNRNTIYAENQTDVSVMGGIDNRGLLASGKTSTVTTQGRIVNTGVLGSKGTATVSAVSIANVGTLGASGGLIVNGTITGNGKVIGLINE